MVAGGTPPRRRRGAAVGGQAGAVAAGPSGVRGRVVRRARCRHGRLCADDEEDQEEEDTLRVLVYISLICQRSAVSKDLVLRVLVEDNDDDKKLGKGDTIHTIIKFLSNKLSGHEPTCKRIVAVGTGSSKSESVVAVDKVESMLCNLDRFEANAQHEVGPTTPDCNYSSPGCFNANVKQAAMATRWRTR
uniref:Uncharacterized protein n=1 Tax=Oryza sativa subsp. japonica TaxID=39947 RepID=Q69RR4_ORYSJ|nr:hypothetical protein [Oryza sativa Japonica Group]